MNVSSQDQRHAVLRLAAMLGAIIVTAVIGGLILFQFSRVQESQILSVPPTPVEVPELGVFAEITAGDVTITRQLAELSWTLDPGQSLDSRLPPGPFRARCDVRFMRGRVQLARLGAVLRNGSLIIRRDGEVLLADHVGDEPRTVLTSLPVELPAAVASLTYEYECTGDGPWMLQAVWQPDGSQAERQLPGVRRGGRSPVPVRGVDSTPSPSR